MCKIVSKNAHSFKSALISMYAMQFHLEMSKNIYSNTTTIGKALNNVAWLDSECANMC